MTTATESNKEALRNQLVLWKKATSDTPPGVQHLIYDALQLVSSGDIKLAWGADVYKGTPCLLNAVSNMTTQMVEPGKKLPANYTPNVVRLFDLINKTYSYVLNPSENKSQGYVDPIAADMLIRHFGELKEIEVTSTVADFKECEPTSNELQAELVDWLAGTFEGIDATA
jgi:hypothetical protein